MYSTVAKVLSKNFIDLKTNAYVAYGDRNSRPIPISLIYGNPKILRNRKAKPIRIQKIIKAGE